MEFLDLYSVPSLLIFVAGYAYVECTLKTSLLLCLDHTRVIIRRQETTFCQCHGILERRKRLHHP